MQCKQQKADSDHANAKYKRSIAKNNYKNTKREKNNMPTCQKQCAVVVYDYEIFVVVSQIFPNFASRGQI